MTAISEKDFEEQALPELAALLSALDAHPDDLLAELGGDVLTIEFPDQSRYVINSHVAARQIWVAAERNAWHFDYSPEKKAWIERKAGAELWSTLEHALARKAGHAVPLKRGR